MVNVRYLASVLKPELSNGSKGTIKKSLFLNDDDINLLTSNGCVLSIHSDGVVGRYNVEFDRQHLLNFCN